MTTFQSQTQPNPPTLREPPVVRGNHFFGNARELQADRLGFLLRNLHAYGEVAQLRVFGRRVYTVYHPDGIKHILQENHANYVKGPFFDPIRAIAGNGLFTADGELWLRQRRLLQPAFHRQRIASFGQVMTDQAVRMLARWDEAVAAEPDKPVDVSAEMVRLTMAVVAEAMFGAAVDDEADAISAAIQVGLEDIQFRFDRPFYPPLGWPLPHNRRVQAAIRTLDQTVFQIIERRRSSGEEKDDLLGMLMAARDEGASRGMDDRQLRDEVITIFVAGHETTARLLTWVFYLLDQHPAVAARLRAELATVLGGRTPTMADLPHLTYTRQVIDETLRLYPPVWITNRQALTADDVMGYRIPAGALVSISPYAAHRHPAFWTDPERFDPERFSPEQAAGRHRFAYLPFGGGPRQCIGNTFALTEAVLILATMAQRYQLRLPPNSHVEVVPQATLQPRGGMPMLVTQVAG
ncbi:MAG: cytochrome P450 [Caldilineaceae bacterium]|nr:cytochrome P450 [Caldilineaceae bacterium]